MHDFFTIITHPFAMLWYGMVLHALKALAEGELNGVHTSPCAYLKLWPYSAAFTVISGIVGYSALFGTDELTRINAFGLGFMANSVADVIGQRGLGVLTHEHRE